MKQSHFNVPAIPSWNSGRIQMPRVWILALVGSVILFTLSMSSKSAHAGKPIPPPPPPVKFQLTIAPVQPCNIKDMNDSGTLVGESVIADKHAIVVHNLQEIDLNDAFIAPEGWYFATAQGINQTGSIVGSLGQYGASINDVRRPFLIRAEGWSTGSFEVLPFGMSPYVAGMDINDDGTILASFKFADGSFGAYTYEMLFPAAPQELPLPRSREPIRLINNSVSGRPAQIAGETFDPQASANRTYWRYTLGDSNAQVWSFANSWFYPYGLNDSGSFCFGAIRPKPGNKSQYMAARYSDGLGYQTFVDATHLACSINEAGDMAISSSTLGVSPQLYSEGLGVLQLNDLLVGASADVQLFRAGQCYFPRLTNRGSLNSQIPRFPGIAGVLGAANGTFYLFMLVPVAP